MNVRLFIGVVALFFVACSSSKAANVELGDPCNADGGATTCPTGQSCVTLDAPPNGAADARCSTICKSDSDCAQVTCPASTTVSCVQSATSNDVCGCVGT